MSPNFLPLVFSLLAFAVSAGEQPTVDRDLASCVNGEVSPSGAFPAQAVEEQIDAFVTRSAETGRFYNLFEVAGNKLSETHRKR
ncbi:MAG: hypothetical protein LJE70_04830 [Chromatiaceae bacterium]|jgi:hypothetical protein|nr:hypothetical protein [Chromatiaceae bacterium]